MRIKGASSGLLLAMTAWLAGCAVTPEPLTLQERIDKMNLVRTEMYKDQEPVTGVITLEEAMARAVKYNLDHRLKLMEEVLNQKQLDSAWMELLPRLTAEAGYTNRNNYSASSSMDVVTWTESLVPSTSSEKDRVTAALNLTWNILDFGVSYFRAHQQADRTLIAQERKRKVVHNLMQQVRQAFWRAVGAQQVESRVITLLAMCQKAMEDVKKMEKAQLQPPLELLRYQKTLLETIRQLESLRDELAMAKPQLAALINIKPSESFTLAVPQSFLIPRLKLDLPQMEERALLNRPELIEADYQERISVLETKKSLARLLPGIELSVGANYDSNDFLVNKNWIEGGPAITWNLLKLLSGPQEIAAAEAQEQVSHTQRLALSMAALSQVHVAQRDYTNTVKQFALSESLMDVDLKIYDLVQKGVAGESQNKLEEIRTATVALTAELRRYQTYAALHNSYGNMRTSLGMDPLPKEVNAHDIKTLSDAIVAADKTDADYLTAQQVFQESVTASSRAKSANAPAKKPAKGTSEAKAPATSAQASAVDNSVMLALRTWADAWSSRQVEPYLAAYSALFAPSHGQSLEAWRQERIQRLTGGKGPITIELNNVHMEVKDGVAQVFLTQGYRSESYKDKVRKAITLKQENGVWKIVSEVAKP